MSILIRPIRFETVYLKIRSYFHVYYCVFNVTVKHKSNSVCQIILWLFSMKVLIRANFGKVSIIELARKFEIKLGLDSEIPTFNLTFLAYFSLLRPVISVKTYLEMTNHKWWPHFVRLNAYFRNYGTRTASNCQKKWPFFRKESFGFG